MTERHTPRDSARRSWKPWAVAFGCWVLFIWGHSLVQGPASSLESGRVVALLRPIFEAVGVTDHDLMSLIVRKCAHFSEYAVLGVIARGLFSRLASERGVPAWVGVLAVAAVPVCDECLQLFVPGRTGLPTDVLIDLSGAVTGALLAWAFSRWLAGRNARCRANVSGS